MTDKEPKALTDKEVEALIKKIQEEHFLIEKSKWFSFLGGFVACIIAAGLLSYQGAIQAVSQSGAVMATQEIRKKADEAESLSQELLDIKEEIIHIREQVEEFYGSLQDRESKSLSDIKTSLLSLDDQLSKTEKLFGDLQDGKSGTLSDIVQSLDARLSVTENLTKTFSEFHTTYRKSYLSFGEPKGNDNTNHIWGDGDSIVLGGQIQLRGVSGDDDFRIRHYPDRGYTRVSSQRIRVETGAAGAAELVVNGNLRIENGTITVKGREIQTK